MRLVTYFFISLSILYIAGCGDPCCEQETQTLSPLAKKTPPESIIKGLYDQNITAGDIVTLTGDSSLDLDGNIKEHTWSINNVVVSNDENLTFNFNKVGINQVCLKVTDNDNISDETCRYISVQPKPINLPPLAKLPKPVITVNGEDILNDNNLSADTTYTLSCENSYDQDNIDSDNAFIMGLNGDITKCLWTVDAYNYEGHKKINCVRQNSDGSWRFCGHANYIEIILTVKDDENQTFTDLKRYYTYGSY